MFLEKFGSVMGLSGRHRRRKKVCVSGSAGVEVLALGFLCCRMPSLAPQECSVEPDKGKVRGLVVVVVLVLVLWQQRGL